MCVYIYIHTYIYLQTCIRIYIRVLMFASTQEQPLERILTCIHVYTHSHMHTCVRAFSHAYMCVRAFSDAYMCVRASVYDSLKRQPLHSLKPATTFANQCVRASL